MNALRLRQEISTESIPSLRRRETVDPVWYHTMRITASLPPKEYQQYFPQARKRRATCRYIIKRSLETFWRGVVGILDGVCFFSFVCVFSLVFSLQRLDKPRSQVSSLPPLCVPSLALRRGFSIPNVRRFSSDFANSRSRASRSSIFYARRSPYEHEYEPDET